MENNNTSNISNELNHDKWINTIPKKNTTNSFQKYSLMTALFIFGLLSVSVVKNETRNLQKEINNLESSVNIIRYNLDQAILDRHMKEITLFNMSSGRKDATQTHKPKGTYAVAEGRFFSHHSYMSSLVRSKGKRSKRIAYALHICKKH